MFAQFGKGLLFSAALVIGSHAPAFATSSPFSPALTVNGEMLSVYDLEQHRRLNEAFGSSDLTEDQLLDDFLTLVLKRQFGERLGEVPAAERNKRIVKFYEDRGLTREGYEDVLRKTGLDNETVGEFIAAELLWREVLRARFQAQVLPTDTEVEALFTQQAARADREVLLAEIAMSVFEYGPENLNQLVGLLVESFQKGASFEEAARRFSQGSTAAQGGVLGWWRPAELAEPFNRIAAQMRKGQISQPFGIENGAAFLKVVDERAVPSDLAKRVTLDYVSLPLPADADVAQARIALESCDVNVPEGAVRSGAVNLAQLPSDLARVLGLQPVGLVSQPHQGALYLVCKREIEVTPQERSNIVDSIFSRRLSVLEDSFLTELRDNAYIEVR